MAPVDPMDLVRSFYAALNQGDVAAMAVCLAPDCIAEQVFLDDDGVYEGRDTVCNRWHDDVRRHPGAFPGGHRVEVDRIAGLETGWGWVQADWRLAVLDGGPASIRHEAGSTHFWIEGGLIRLRGSGETAQFADKLQRCVANFEVCGRRLEIKQRLYIAAHMGSRR